MPHLSVLSSAGGGRLPDPDFPFSPFAAKHKRSFSFFPSPFRPVRAQPASGVELPFFFPFLSPRWSRQQRILPLFSSFCSDNEVYGPLGRRLRCKHVPVSFFFPSGGYTCKRWRRSPFLSSVSPPPARKKHVTLADCLPFSPNAEVEN